MLKNKTILMILSLSLFFSCKWRVEDQPGYWVITFPQDGATCNEKVTLSIDANDPDGICGVEINVNDLKIDIPLSEILGNINNEPIEVSLNTNELPDGPISVSVSICDCNDNCTESPPLDYTVDNTLSVPDTISINSVIFKDGGFDILWEKSNAPDFNQYDLYHSLNENLEDFSIIYSSNEVSQLTYYLENVDPLVYNYFYVMVSDSFNYSTKGPIYTSSLDPEPEAINIESVLYDESQMYITWLESPDSDFLKYEIYFGENDTLNVSLLDSVFDKSLTTFSINEFDPHLKNYFRIIVYDTLNQNTKGDFNSNETQPTPEPVILDSISSFGNELTINWSAYSNLDFQRYNFYRAFDANMNNKEILFSTTDRLDTNYFSNGNDYDATYYFVVSVVDLWGYEVFSNVNFIIPQYFTFLNNYNVETESISGYYGIQNTTEQYKIIGKSSSDIYFTHLDRYGENIAFQPLNYNESETPIKLLQGQSENTYLFASNVINGFEDTDIKITKTDQNGSIIWESIIGYDIDGENTNYGYDISNDIILSNDGGYIITGQYHAQHPDILVAKIDDQGSIQNKHIISTAPSSQRVVESGKSILSIDNGYIILASLSQSSANGPSDIWLSEYIESTLNVGDTTWTQTWDINTFDIPEKLIKKTDGSYALSGYSLNSGGEIESSWIINSDISGNELSTIIISGDNYVYDLIENSNGDYIIAGKKFNDNDYQGWIACIDIQGNIVWEKTYGEGDNALFRSIKQTSDGGFIITGEAQTDGISSILHAKTDPDGNIY